MMPSTAAPSDSPVRAGSALNITLWIVQVLVFAVFGMAGFTKVTTPMDQLARMMTWTTSVPPTLVRFIGAAELAGAIGVVLPALTRILPSLTPLAALGLGTVMGLASAFHLSRGEAPNMIATIVLGGLAAFVAWGRARRAPIRPRA